MQLLASQMWATWALEATDWVLWCNTDEEKNPTCEVIKLLQLNTQVLKNSSLYFFRVWNETVCISKCFCCFCTAGQLVFEDFLRTEYSDENLLFWLACKKYKKITRVTEMTIAAKRIYTEFVQVGAPRQVWLLWIEE